jgi:hypothetical protein
MRAQPILGLRHSFTVMQSWIDHHPNVLPILFPAFFVGMCLLVCAITSTFSGWSALTERFRIDGTFPGQRWRKQSGVMRGQTYGGLTLGCNENGLYLGVHFTFRFMHPPLLIPWDQITVSRRKIFFFDFVRFELGREERVPLWIRAYRVEKIKDAAGEHWPVETIG